MHKYAFAILLAIIAVFSTLFACEQQPYRMGERLYKTNCANCHMDNGVGLGALMPPLADSDYLVKNRDRIVCIIQNGLQDTIIVNGQMYAEQMPGNNQLSEIQITNIANYLFQSWGNQVPPITFEDAQKALKACR